MDYRAEAPEVIKDFLTYHETIKGHSKKTVDEYYLDLRTFFRYLKIIRGIVPRSTELDEISIRDIDIDFVKSVTVSEVYEYLAFLTRDRVKPEKQRRRIWHKSFDKSSKSIYSAQLLPIPYS